MQMGLLLVCVVLVEVDPAQNSCTDNSMILASLTHYHTAPHGVSKREQKHGQAHHSQGMKVNLEALVLLACAFAHSWHMYTDRMTNLSSQICHSMKLCDAKHTNADLPREAWNRRTVQNMTLSTCTSAAYTCATCTHVAYSEELRQAAAPTNDSAYSDRCCMSGLQCQHA